MNLLLHCGARRVEREQLESSPTPPRTKTWVPIPHHHLLAQIEAKLAENQLRVVNQAHALWGNGRRYFGLLEVQNGAVNNETAMVVGIRNSHDRSLPAGIALGSGVFVCDNLCFFGDITLARRHTTFIERDLPKLIGDAIVQLSGLRQSQSQRIAHYKTSFLPDRDANDLIVRAIDAGVITPRLLPGVVEEWRRPRHREFRMGGRSIWRLHNAFTENLKGNLTALPRRSAALHRLLDAECRFNQPQNLN